MDLTRFAALLTIPVAYALGRLSFAQLLVVSVVVAAAEIAFKAASGAYLKALVPAGGPARRQRPVRVDDLERDRGRAAAGRRRDRPVRPGDDDGGRRGQLPALGAGHPRDRRRAEPLPARTGGPPAAGRRPARRLAPHPRPPGAAPAVPQRAARQRPDHGHRAAAGRAPARPSSGSRPGSTVSPSPRPASAGSSAHALARRLVARFGQHRVLLASGHAARGLAGRPRLRPARRPRDGARHRRRSSASSSAAACTTRCWPPTGSSTPTPDRVARTLSAWSVSSSAAIALLTAAWGLLAAATSPRTAIALAGVLLLGHARCCSRAARRRRGRRWSRPRASPDGPRREGHAAACLPTGPPRARPVSA